MNSKSKTAVLWALLAAALYGISSPAAKILLARIPPALMASLLYLGAGLGMACISFTTRKRRKPEAAITKRELPYVFGMIALDIAAPFLLMIGLKLTAAANASLLSNFEIVATSLIALFIFKETIGKRLWLAIALITAASVLLSAGDAGSFAFSPGSALILLACVCWGFENNCTRMLSVKNPMQVVIIKGLGSGTGSLLLAFALKEQAVSFAYIAAALVLGFFAYGLSIYFYVCAQRELGAARTSAYYAISPFVGVMLSFIVFREKPTLYFLAALLIMIAGAYLASGEKHSHAHTHEAATHEHRHTHSDGHHNHAHTPPVPGEHSHMHTHEPLTHAHFHMPDIHHTHAH